MSEAYNQNGRGFFQKKKKGFLRFLIKVFICTEKKVWEVHQLLGAVASER